MKKALEEKYVSQFINMQKLITDIWKVIIKIKNRHILNIGDVNNLSGRAMSQKLPVNKFEWIESTSQFNEDYKEGRKEESDEGYFLKVDVQYSEKLQKLHNDLPFLPEEMKIKKLKNLLLIDMIKLNMSFT